jgi:protein tyrosine phosphatase
VHYPIHDFNEGDLTSKLYDGAKVLNDMINNQGLNVYVHCTAGMGRAPAVVLVYFCLYKPDYDYGFNFDEDDDKWMDLPVRVDAFVRTHRKVSVPNMRAVRNVVNSSQTLS